MNPVDPMPLRREYFGDAEAFCTLVRDHAGMVFATARRITGDAALAEDVAQETFLALARQRHNAVESVGAWLHRVAWRKASNAVRSEARRRRHEESAMEMQVVANEASWKELEPLIDQILEELPEHLREPLVEHFLEGQTQQHIAERRRVSQATVSRQLDAGLDELRNRMRARGVLCGTGLAALLGTQAAEAAPPTLTTSLGKLALSGIGSNTAHVAGSVISLILAMNATKVALAVIAIAAVIGVPVLLEKQSSSSSSKVAEAKPATAPAPVPISKPIAAQPAKSQPSKPAPKIYHPPPVPENVRFKVDAFIRRHKGMTMQELLKDPEFEELGKRFSEAIEAPEAEARLEKVMEELKQTKGTEIGQLNVNFSEDGGFDGPVGRSWLEAMVSGDPQLAQDWMINKLEGASFEFTADPTLETSSEGVRVFPKSAKPANDKSPKL